MLLDKFSSEFAYSVLCYRIILTKVSNVFKRTPTAELEKFSIYLLPADRNEVIPRDVLNSHRVRNIEITCDDSANFYLRVDPQAFGSSRNTTRSIHFYHCDMSRLNFDFLTGFHQIHYIWFPRTLNIGLANWASFPLLPSLERFSISYSTGLNEWTTFPKLGRGLNRLELYSNDIQDAAMDRILNWAEQHSADTLEQLKIDGNDLQNIPRQLGFPALFSKLQYLHLGSQKNGISVIPSGSFYFNSSHITLSRLITIRLS